ncbi:MAG: hypothetical protein K2Q34_03465 [Alphaproteobacteria bacterium]|nr:hypothetical protein [Alphaproteobacteria bacterium]
MTIIIKNIMRVCVLYCFTCTLSTGAEIATYSTSDAEFQSKVARKALDLYQTINTSGKFRFPALNEDGIREELNTPSHYWDKVTEYNSQLDMTVEMFVMKPVYKPSVALIDLLEKGGVVECGIIVSLVNQCITLDMLGDTFFNFVKWQEPFVLPSKRTLFLDDSSTDIVPANPGEFGYIANVADYSEIHPQSFHAGENVFCVESTEPNVPRYVVFGEFVNESKTEEQIVDQLYASTMDTSDGCDVEEIEKYKDRSFWDEERFANQMNFPVYKYSYEEFKQAQRALLELFSSP